MIMCVVALLPSAACTPSTIGFPMVCDTNSHINHFSIPDTMNCPHVETATENRFSGSIDVGYLNETGFSTRLLDSSVE